MSQTIGTPGAAGEADYSYFQQQDGDCFAGKHLLLDLWHIEAMEDAETIEACLKSAAEEAGATVLHSYFHHFKPNAGITGIVALSESHISIHTWPEAHYAAVDIFLCGDTDPEKACNVICRTLKPRQMTVNNYKRGITEPQTWFVERDAFQDSAAVSLRKQRTLFEGSSDFQRIDIFDNHKLGRVLALDHVVQLTTSDEFIYHEMFAHVPLLTHPWPRKVLIIGGGDGGLLREVLKHPVDDVTLVEIDEQVINLSQQFLPQVCGEAFDDARVQLVFKDGLKFLGETEAEYDVILVDSTDPDVDSPAQLLYQMPFYRICHDKLSAGGVFVQQNGPAFYSHNLAGRIQGMGNIYQQAACYTACVPSFYESSVVFLWGTKAVTYELDNTPQLKERSSHLQGAVHHYTPGIQRQAFTLPAWLDV